MASQVLTNAMLWLAGYKLTGAMNALALDYGAELQDATVFGDTGRRRRAGLKTQVFNHQGYWDVGTGVGDASDEVLFPLVGVDAQPMLISPNGVEGEPAYILRSVTGAYAPGAQIGQMFKFTVRGEGAVGEPLLAGTLLKNAVQGVGSGTGTAFNVGAVSATQKLYAALQYVGSGLSAARVESDTSGFPSPTTVVTFTGLAAARGTDWQVIAGPITDTWWRVGWTVTAGTPEFVVTIVIV